MDRFSIACVFMLALVACEADYGGKLESFEGSHLPVVVIDTSRKRIRDEPKQTATLQLYEDGLMDLAEIGARAPDFESRVGVELRGHTSQEFPKKQYGLELWDTNNDDVEHAVLGMPADADWVLSAPFMDKSLVRNDFAYGLARSLGHYAPRTRFVELFLNDVGAVTIGTEHYRGVYVWTEKIKRGDQRVAIEKQDDAAARAPEIEGGYLLQWTRRERVRRSERWFASASGAALIVEYPKPEDLNDEKLSFISSYVAAFEDALEADGDDFLDYIEMDSFVDYLLLNELLRSHDVFTSSTFISKTRAGKLAMGPLWDLDRALGDVEFDGNWRTAGFLLPTRGWGKQLFEKPSFLSAYRARWRELRNGPLATDVMLARIDEGVAKLGAAVDRNFERWRVLGRYVKANRAPYAKTHEEECAKMRRWLIERAAWLDAHIDEL